LNVSSRASRDIELEDLGFVFEHDIELNLLLKASKESEIMATINPSTTNPPAPFLLTVGNEVIEITATPQANLRLYEDLYKKDKGLD